MESRIEWLRTATALFLAWSFLTFLVRVWVKAGYTRNWGWSDSTIAVAFVVATAHVATVFHAINYGFGSPIDSVTQAQRETFEKSLYAGSILYVIAVGFSKCSTALFIASLTRYGPQIRLAYVMTGVAGLWTVASLLVIALRGSLSQPWMTLDGSQPVYIRWIVIESTGLIVEAMLFGLAISLVWRLNMPLRRRTLILMAFGCRLLLTPLVALRLYFLSPAKNSDPTVSGIVFGIFTEAALQYSLVSASATCLKPFLQPLHSGHLVTSIGQPGSGFAGTSNVSYDPYYKLSTVGVQDKDGPSTPSTQKDTPSGGGRLRPDFSEFSATAEGGHESPESVISRDQDSRSMVIKSSKTFLVSKVKV